MGDMGDVFREMTAIKKERHAKWHEDNRAVIVASGVPFQDRGEALLFRGKIKADFYPSTGRWRANNKNHSGGATKFLNWWSTRK